MLGCVSGPPDPGARCAAVGACPSIRAFASAGQETQPGLLLGRPPPLLWAPLHLDGSLEGPLSSSGASVFVVFFQGLFRVVIYLFFCVFSLQSRRNSYRRTSLCLRYSNVEIHFWFLNSTTVGGRCLPGSWWNLQARVWVFSSMCVWLPSR